MSAREAFCRDEQPDPACDCVACQRYYARPDSADPMRERIVRD